MGFFIPTYPPTHLPTYPPTHLPTYPLTHSPDESIKGVKNFCRRVLGFYHSRIDGAFGRGTRRSLQAAQHELDIQASGEVDNRTAKAINQLLKQAEAGERWKLPKKDDPEVEVPDDQMALYREIMKDCGIPPYFDGIPCGWPEAIRRYNGSGADAEAYRDEILTRITQAEEKNVSVEEIDTATIPESELKEFYTTSVIVPSIKKKYRISGLFGTVRTPTNYRRFPESEINRLFGKLPHSIRCAIYARVSVCFGSLATASKQEVSGNLERQRSRLIEYAQSKGYEIVQVFSEQASGINENRKQLKKLIQLAVNKEIDVVLIEFKDRLARFGYSYLVDFFSSHNVRVETIATKPPQDATSELMEDMLSIITCFAARLYGKRSDPSQAQDFKKKIEQAIKEDLPNGGSDKNHQNQDNKPQ